MSEKPRLYGIEALIQLLKGTCNYTYDIGGLTLDLQEHGYIISSGAKAGQPTQWAQEQGLMTFTTLTDPITLIFSEKGIWHFYNLIREWVAEQQQMQEPPAEDETDIEDSFEDEFEDSFEDEMEEWGWAL